MVNHPDHDHEGLRRSEALLRTVVETMGEGVVVADLEGEVLHWNPAALRLHGFCSRKEAPLRYADLTATFELASPEGGAVGAEDRPLARVLRGETLRDHELRVRSRSAGWTRVFSYGGSLALDPAGRPLMAVVTVRDVTAQRRLEEQLRQAEKLESVGRLAGGVAHDFNNLLTVILSCCQALREDLGAGRPASLEDVEEIRAAGARAGDLTRQLLAFARRQAIAPVTLDLNGVVSGSERLLRRVLGGDVDLVVRVQPDLWSASCDPGQMEQVIVNLAVNARDAMPGGGRLVIETSNLEVRGEDRGPQPTVPAGEYVRLRVQDTGVGMAPDVQERAFEPFFTTKEVGKGTGLGLATVYGIVKQNRGFIQVESQPGRGTAFEICLPRSPAPPAGFRPVPP